MSNTAQIAAHLHDLSGRYNRELASEAVGKAALGIVFSFVTFGKGSL